MARKSNPQPLMLTDPRSVDEHDFFDNPRSPLSPKSPRSPRSPFKFGSKKIIQTDAEQPPMQATDPLRTRTTLPPSQNTVSLPSLDSYTGAQGPPRDRQDLDKEQRPPKTGFFSTYKAAKSSSRLHQNQNQDAVKQSSEDSMYRDSDHPSKVSLQEHSKTGTTHLAPSASWDANTDLNCAKDSSVDKSTTRKPVGGPTKSDVSVDSTGEATSFPASSKEKKSKPKGFSLLSRTRSIRDENSPRETSPTDKLPLPPPERGHQHAYSDSIKTAPLRMDNDRTFRDMMDSGKIRQHSEDRQTTRRREASREKTPREPSKLQSSMTKDTPKDHIRNPTNSSSYQEKSHGGGGGGFLNNLRTTATKGAGAIHKGLFGKSSRSGSTTEKEQPVDDEHYELKVINKPLVEQTRLTRISKRLEDSRDKTEFWMPAFPWRAIDYLNYKGSDVEGLYRVPGSGPQIKKWQRKFDEEMDIDLFEQDDLYDINIIGSMLKAWLRELPDELFPKSAQDRISRECMGAETVPPQLVDELSNLSPFNYYLLFAITCHLSLLLAHSEKNKMDFRNLCICFQPCMKIDAFCFKFLVCDWRDCWKGCKTETSYTEQEYILFDMAQQPPPGSREGQSSTAIESHDERNVSSSDSSKPSSVSIDNQSQRNNSRDTPKKLSLSQGPSGGSMSTVNTTLTVVQERTPPRQSSDMRPLSPIKPLSPIGL